MITCKHFLAGALMLASAPLSGAPADSPAAGHWAGWLYLDAGGDAPLRLHVGETDSVRATLDLPHARLFEDQLLTFEVEGDRIRFERRNSQGQLQVYRGVLEGDTIEGKATLGEASGRFQLHRSPLSLPQVDPDSYADLAGFYRFPSGRRLLLTPRFWGEMLLLDTSSGRYVTLFPLSSERFFTGPAMYVPAPITGRLEVRRQGGRISEITFGAPEGTSEKGERVELIREEVQFDNGPVKLSGTLIRSDGDGPWPAVVVLGGSGWGERDSVRRDGDILASFGLAALIYDKRGHGESVGEQTVAFAETAKDAVAAVRFLRERSDIRPARVGLFGRSRGGWLAPLAASLSDGEVAFQVLFVAPAISPARQETTRRLNLLRAAGHTEAEIEEARAYLELIWRYARTGEGWDEYARQRAEMEKRGWLDVLGGAAEPDPAEWAWARLNMHYAPLPVLRRLKTPTLAVFGARDPNVVPGENLPLMQQAFEEAGNTDFTALIAEDADHSLRLVSDEGLALHLRSGYAPEVWSTVQRWLAERLAPGR